MANVPVLRFPGFNTPWNNIRLFDVCKVITKGTTPGSFSTKGVNYIKIECLIDSEFSKDKCLSVEEEVHTGILRRSILQECDILFAIAGATVGKIGVVKKEILPANTNQAFAIIRLKNKKMLWFVFYTLQSKAIMIYINQCLSVGAQPNLSLKQMGDFQFFTGAIEEQKKIANFLTTTDTKIQQLQQKQTLLQQYKKGVMQQLFSQALRFKDDDGGDYPDWEESQLGDIGKTYNGLTGKTAVDFGSGMPFVTYKQIFDSTQIDLSKCSFVAISENERQNKVRSGDVFFTISSETPSEVGYSSVLLNCVGNVYLNSFCFGYRVKSKEKLLPEYAQYAFMSDGFRRKVVRLAQGSTRYNMSKTGLMNLKLFLPTKLEQQKIANFFSAIDKKITQTTQQLHQAQAFKKGLLQQMFV